MLNVDLPRSNQTERRLDEKGPQSYFKRLVRALNGVGTNVPLLLVCGLDVFMNAEFIAMLDYLERERGIKREILLEAVSNALLSASKKSVGAARDLRIDIDPRTGDIRALANLVVVDHVGNPQDEIALAKARRIKPDAKVGDTVEVKVTPRNFGRIAAQTAKQAMTQRIRQVEKEMIYEEFKDRAGEIVSGTVRGFDRSDVILDLGKFEAVMPQRERVVVEDYNVGDRLRAYVVAVENGLRGPEIIVSRSHPNFVRRLFELEVSEIADGTVQIRGIAREAGYRTKIAVWSANDKVDPVGACVGMRGSRVKNIVRELNNEKVDIIRWSSDPKEFVLEALKPAKVKNIVFDPEKKSAQISVDEDQLSLAIGKKGQNARLTSRLTGWEINIDKDTSATTAVEQKVAQAAQTLAGALPISEEQAVTLVKSGFTNLEGLHAADVQDLIDILSVDEAKAREIHDAVHKQDAKQEAGSAQPG